MAPDARERNAAAERLVRELIERGDLLYGVTTGVGALRVARRPRCEDPGDHQWRLLRSHAGGGGAPLTTEVVRAAMAVRANQIGAGGAGVGDSLLDALLGALRAGRDAVRARARLARHRRPDRAGGDRRWRSAARATAGSATTSCRRPRRWPRQA